MYNVIYFSKLLLHIFYIPTMEILQFIWFFFNIYGPVSIFHNFKVLLMISKEVHLPLSAASQQSWSYFIYYGKNWNIKKYTCEKLRHLNFTATAEVFYNANNVNVNYFVKNSAVDCKHLLFLWDFFFRLKPE